MMMQLKGRKETESFILDSWNELREETRGELLYSGIANPDVLSNEFYIELFDRSTDVGDKRTIVGSLYSTMQKRNFPRSLLCSMFRNLGRLGDTQRDGELDAFVSKWLKVLSGEA